MAAVRGESLRFEPKPGFVMLTGERQIEDLDELIDLRRDSEVSFIRLMPLVGG